ncbi:hypothetical protein PRIPAC_70660 [Pristionchus pacificus]|uniref:Uncharacterized protein n=1 Tax=Pristionchus pacificus TaxID=54126 RepID=A0A2A6B4T0_PRIPA|nr:hypothetical protein PRIPAC_70660 [Pristionchus pacificus]|eukprot:PDM60895.1 hypothetical protein PRIPAC_54701 [Pristionchus pacificus]
MPRIFLDSRSLPFQYPSSSSLLYSLATHSKKPIVTGPIAKRIWEIWIVPDFMKYKCDEGWTTIVKYRDGGESAYAAPYGE